MNAHMNLENKKMSEEEMREYLGKAFLIMKFEEVEGEYYCEAVCTVCDTVEEITDVDNHMCYTCGCPYYC